jgi:hypothetical protein
VLEHLEVKQRTELVDTALAMEKPVFKAGLISALAQGLQFLGRSQRNTFVEEVLKMNGENSGWALCGLGNGMGCLSAHQRTELFNKTLAVLPMEVRAEAIIGMAGGLGFLTAGERVGFVDAVVTLPHSVKRSEAISATGLVTGDAQNTPGCRPCLAL